MAREGGKSNSKEKVTIKGKLIIEDRFNLAKLLLYNAVV